MQTGRLIKFHRPGGDLQAYLFRDRERYCGLVYLPSSPEPIYSEDGLSEQVVEAGLRTWIDQHFPRDPGDP